MKVLIVIGILFTLLLVYVLVKELNRLTNERFNCMFFTNEYFYFYAVINLGLFFGYRWYESELISSGDILSGILIMFFATCLLFYVFVKNIKASNFVYGVVFTLVQVVIYLPLTVMGLFVLFGLISYFSQTRPVYKVN